MKLLSKFILSILFSAQLTMCNTAPANASAQEDAWITIFVHGIMSVQPHLCLETVLRLLHDRVQGSFYESAVKAIRTDPFFHRNQAMQGLGLIPIDKSSSYAGDASCALATLFDEVYQSTFGRNSTNNHYYTYGWSGLLSPSIRLYESKEFYRSIVQELASFKARGINPKIRIIGYSHGGNVVLGLAQAQREHLKSSSPAITVDEVILLGVPIQPETDFLVRDKMFNKIYHFYSLSDRIQTIDCFSLKRFGSNKIFKQRCDFELPDKLMQVELRLFRNTRLTKRRARHKDKRYKFESTHITAGRSHGLRNASPGHCELWFFGWTHAHYRTHFPLSPLPIVGVLPYILEHIKAVESEFPRNHHLVVDIRPQQETMIIRTKKRSHFKHVLPFLSRDQMDELKDISREFSFKRVTWGDYKEHIEAAFEKTREEFSQKLFSYPDTCPK